MKIAISIIGLISISGLIYLLISCNTQSLKSKENQIVSDSTQINKHEMSESRYETLRKMAFERNSNQLGLNKLNDNDIYGVIMDYDFGNAMMTLVSYRTGDASIYLNSGGGVIGGVQNENVNKASKQFVELAEKFLVNSIRIDSIQSPSKDCIGFYLLTANGKYFMQDQINNIENRTSPLFEYYIEANKVITELRLSTEGK